MANFVQLYKSTDQNALPLFGAAGSLIALLNAYLVNGLPSGISVTSITKSGTTATVTVSSANGLYFQTGQWVTISGATGGDGSDYNGTFKITSTGATTFTYTMGGTPGANAAGTLLASLLQPITSITRGGAGNLTATVTLTNPDTSLQTGQYVTISGCTSTGASQYNITAKITVISTTSFSYTVGSDPGANASGSPVYTRAPLGWTLPYSAGTNSQTYRSADSSSNQFYLQVIDNAATAGAGKEAQIYGAEVMSADQTVTSGRFPTSVQFASGLCWRKSTTADSTTARAWTLIGDDRTFYLVMVTGDAVSAGYHGGGFGYFIPFKSGDAYNTFIAGGVVFNNSASTSVLSGLMNNCGPGAIQTVGFFLPRLYTQTGTAVNGQMGAPFNANLAGFGSAQVNAQNVLAYPNPDDSGLYMFQPCVIDSANALRGRVPGVFAHMHNVVPVFQNYDQITGVTGLSGVTLTNLVTCGYSASVGQMLFDTFGPWT